MEIVQGILLFACMIGVWILYHSIFSVTYFSANGCLTEIIMCGFIGGLVYMFLGALIITHWKLILAVLVGIGILKSVMSNR